MKQIRFYVTAELNRGKVSYNLRWQEQANMLKEINNIADTAIALGQCLTWIVRGSRGPARSMSTAQLKQFLSMVELGMVLC